MLSLRNVFLLVSKERIDSFGLLLIMIVVAFQRDVKVHFFHIWNKWEAFEGLK